MVEEDGLLRRYESRELSAKCADELVRHLERALLRDRKSFAF